MGLRKKSEFWVDANVFGFEFKILGKHGDIISEGLKKDKLWESEVSHLFIERCNENLKAVGPHTLVDVGANLGYFSLLHLAMNPENRVIAFEPVIQNFNMMSRSIWKNSFASRITLIPGAISNRCAIEHFNLGATEQTGWGGIWPEKTGFEVLTIPLDSIGESIPNHSVLKIDTEGADLMVLQGAKQLIANGVFKEIFFELNGPRMAQLNLEKNELSNLFKDSQFSVNVISQLDTESFEFHAHRK